MEPALPVGSLVVTERENPSAYEAGDVVTFKAPIGGRPLVTHRLVRVAQAGGTVLATTKGDANANGDPWTLSAGDIIGKERACIPYAGYALELGRTRGGFLTVAGLSFLMLVAGELSSLGSLLRAARKRITCSNQTSHAVTRKNHIDGSGRRD